MFLTKKAITRDGDSYAAALDGLRAAIGLLPGRLSAGEVRSELGPGINGDQTLLGE